MTFIDKFYNNPTLYTSHIELMQQRALNVLNYAFTGYGISFEDAMEKIRNKDTSGLTQKSIDERNMLIGLTDNLINFSVAEEYQMLGELTSDRFVSEDKTEFMAMAMSTFAKYNKTYARTENSDIFYALGLAATWNNNDDNDIIEFHTQEDERVRESHATLNGLRYRKKDFPAALIPPIDWACRCYLINTGTQDGRTLSNKGTVDELIKQATNPIFKYNVAVAGIMFSEEHPYFEINDEDMRDLENATKNIKKELDIWQKD